LSPIETTISCREIKIQGKEEWVGEMKTIFSDRLLAIKKYKNISQQSETLEKKISFSCIM